MNALIKYLRSLCLFSSHFVTHFYLFFFNKAKNSIQNCGEMCESLIGVENFLVWSKYEILKNIF